MSEMKQQSNEFITELKSMLQTEMQKTENQLQFLAFFKNANSLQEVIKICESNGIRYQYSKKFNSIDIYNSNFYTFYGNDTVEENLHHLKMFPLKYKAELEYLIENDNNIQCAINDFTILKNIEYTAQMSKNNFESWTGCNVSKYIQEISKEVRQRYFWKLEGMISPLLNQTRRTIIPEFEKIFVEIYKLQDNAWGGKENCFNDCKKRIATEYNASIIQRLLKSLKQI